MAMWTANVVAPHPPRAERKPNIFPSALDVSDAALRASGGKSLQRLAQRIGQRRIEVFVGARAQGFENQFGRRFGIEHEYGRLGGVLLQTPHELFERHRDTAGLHEHHIHAMPFDAVEQRVRLRRATLVEPVFHSDPHRQILHAGVGLFPDRAVRHDQGGRQRHHAQLGPAFGEGNGSVFRGL